MRLYRRQATRAPRLSRWDMVLLAAIVARYRALASAVVIVQPDTVLRWHRAIVRRKWTFGTTAKCGRPATSAATVALIVRFARENRAWGYGTIQGELRRPCRRSSTRPSSTPRARRHRRGAHAIGRGHLREGAPGVGAPVARTVPHTRGPHHRARGGCATPPTTSARRRTPMTVLRTGPYPIAGNTGPGRLPRPDQPDGHIGCRVEAQSDGGGGRLSSVIADRWAGAIGPDATARRGARPRPRRCPGAVPAPGRPRSPGGRRRSGGRRDNRR